MKAVLSTEPGDPESLHIGDMTPPSPRAGEVLVDVKAVGVNYPDVLIIEDKYQYKPERPFSPGGELSGVIREVGEGVTDLQVGDRILAYCAWGAMAEQATVNASYCAKIPDDMPFEVAAAFIFTYGTAHYALKHRGELRKGEKLLILGAAGGVGMAALEVGLAMGAEIIAACSSQEKADACRAKGAHHTLVYPASTMDRHAQREFSARIKEVSGGGVDVICDAVGGNYAEPSLRSLNWEGRYLVIGFPAGIPSIPLNLPLLKSCDIRGVFWGAWLENFPHEFRHALNDLLTLYRQGSLRPHISSVYAMEDAGTAILELSARRAVGKVVVTISQGG